MLVLFNKLSIAYGKLLALSRADVKRLPVPTAACAYGSLCLRQPLTNAEVRQRNFLSIPSFYKTHQIQTLKDR
jgi:hypothetical protein